MSSNLTRWEFQASILFSFVVWLILYSVGSVIPSEIYRACFDPTVQIDSARLARYRDIYYAGYLPRFPKACAPGIFSAASPSDVVPVRSDSTVTSTELVPSPPVGVELASPVSVGVLTMEPAAQLRAPSVEHHVDRHSDFHVVFTLAALAYPHINVPLLAALAAFLGGCASKLFYSDGLRAAPRAARSDGDGAGNRDDAAGKPSTTTESPLVSMTRGFAVALAYTAGVSIFLNISGEAPTPANYTKYASFVSLLGFLVGYDAGLFNRVLRVFGSPAPASATTK